MLEKIFTEEMREAWHVEYDETVGMDRIKDDCPEADRMKRKKEAEEFFRKEGQHLFANFVET